MDAEGILMIQTNGDPIEAGREPPEAQPEVRKPYAKRQITYELELETRAGSPLGLPDPYDPYDPLGLDPDK